jgi:ornithine cyclodeaminase/alanine dehydrogenase-like protein (mu-crystallin family)
MTQAILLSAADLDRLLEPRALMEQLRSAMIAYDAVPGPRAQRPWSHIPSKTEHSVAIVFPGLVPGIPAYTVKLNAKMPDTRPSVRGLIALIDLETGALLSVMDSVVITRLRTALVGALAAQVLARKHVDAVAVIGAGVQGRAQLRALRMVRDFKTVRVYDSRPANAEALVAELNDELGVSMSVARDVRGAVRGANIVITATWATTPIVTSDMIDAGTHITAVGADAHGKAELDAALIRRSRFVCDDADLAVNMGALAGVGLGHDAIHGTLGAVLGGRVSARESEDDITVYGSVGLACQDLPAAWMAYRTAATHPSATFDFHQA